MGNSRYYINKRPLKQLKNGLFVTHDNKSYFYGKSRFANAIDFFYKEAVFKNTDYVEAKSSKGNVIQLIPKERADLIIDLSKNRKSFLLNFDRIESLLKI